MGNIEKMLADFDGVVINKVKMAREVNEIKKITCITYFTLNDEKRESLRKRWEENRKVIKREDIKPKNDRIRDLFRSKITENETIFDIDKITSICKELGLTFGFRYTDYESIGLETFEGSFYAHLHIEEPILESGKYKIDDYDKRQEVLCEAMLEMNNFTYDIQICWDNRENQN